MNFKQHIDQFAVINYNDDIEYLFDSLKSTFQYREFDGHLFVFNLSENNLWMDFAFFKHSGCEIDYNDKEVNHKGDLFWHGSGTLGNLKELRHSYFSEYVFYASPSFIKKCCDILLEYYEE